jgi:cell division protease FtsH
MSIVKTGQNSSALSTEKRHAWESEETRVAQRRKLRHRIRRLFTLRRVIVLTFLFFALRDAEFMRSIITFIDNSAQVLIQTFSIDLSNVTIILIRLFVGITIAVGQFALIFWFLGNARTYTIWPGTTSEGVSFKDYRGQPELLEQAKQIVTLLRGVRVFEQAGGEPLNGLLLEGPPGTGKTWMAKAISTEAGVPFFYIDASSLMSMFFGIAPLKVMNLYRKARNAAKDYGAAIIFIDEIDAVGSRGGMQPTNTRGGAEQPGNRLPIFFGMGGQTGLLSTLLVEMDGFSAEHGFWARKRTWFYKSILRRKPPKPQKRILTIGATNRVQALDAALLRPGRFDKKVRVDAPDLEGRRDIFEYYLSKIEHDDTLDPLMLASETPFYTPADIKHLLNEALRYALFEGRTYITISDVRLAQPEHEMGIRQPHKNITPEDKYRLAAHESGHAMAVRFFLPHHRISRITIIRQGSANGYVQHFPVAEEYDALGTFESLMNQLRVSVAGRAAELEFAGEEWQSIGVGTGMADRSDFGQIREILWKMANTGMFGPLGANLRGTNYSDEMSEDMENAFQSALEEVRIIFRIHREMGEALIKLLMEKNELFSAEIEAFFDQYGLYTPKIDLTPYRAALAGGQPA